MDQQELLLATIGDLELSRRTLIMQLQEKEQIIEGLRAQLGEQNGTPHDRKPVPSEADQEA